MINEHPFAFTTQYRGKLIQPTLPLLVQEARAVGISAGECTIFPVYRTAVSRHRSVLTHIYAELLRGTWRWRSIDDIARRVMVYYYRPTEDMVEDITYRNHCFVSHIYEEGSSGIDVRVDGADSLAATIGTYLAQRFPHNSIVYSKVRGQVIYRIAVRSVCESQ